jgi:arabinose-5-phosphate isomerase
VTRAQIRAAGGPTSAAADLLREEADAIAKAANRLDAKRFAEAVDALASCRGAVATTGAGTSGIVAQKIAATLTSTGTRAIFVHPTDALHGGLGIIGSEELVIAVSNSGETEEVLALLPYLRRRSVGLIAIVGSLHSRLAREATIALEAHADGEAGLHGVVPTISVAVAGAVGDALALGVMEAKGVSREAFAANHPSGQLGRRLTLRVCDVMHGGDARPMISAQATLPAVVGAITDGGLGAVTILDETGRLLGLITDGDVRRTLQRVDPSSLAALRAEDMMTREPIVVDPDTMAYEALKMMENRPSQIAVLPVVTQDGVCIGVVRLHDLVQIGL